MKKSINFYDFRNEFLNIRPDNFSFEALQVLWQYFEDYESETNIEVVFDPIGICIDFTECTIFEALQNYNLESIEQFQNETIVLPIPNTNKIVYLDY
jgi:hypothetical protein